MNRTDLFTRTVTELIDARRLSDFAFCAVRSGPIEFTSNCLRIRSKPSSSISPSASFDRIPALHIRTSIRVSPRRCASAESAGPSVTSTPTSTRAPVRASASLPLRQRPITSSPRDL